MPVAVASPDGRVAWTWQSASGTTRMLGTPNPGQPVMLPGAQGLGLPPVQIYDIDAAGIHGGIYTGFRYQVREVLLPVVAWGRDGDEWTDARRTLADLFAPGVEHTLVAATAGGSTRRLGLRYVGGLESPQEGERGHVTVGRFAIRLRAYDPFWYGDERSVTWRQSPGSTPFFPGPPWTLIPGSVFGSTTVTNDGAQDVWPTFTIEGPATSATFVGPDGDTFTLTHTLAAGETVTISTDPRVPLAQKVVDHDGTNLWSAISGDGDPFAVFFPLPAGDSAVSASAAGGTSATRITVAWRIAYETW